MNRLSDRTAWLGIGALCVAIAGVLVAIALVTFDGDDASSDSTPPTATLPAAAGQGSAENAGLEPFLDATADHFSLLQSDLATEFTVEGETTFTFGIEGYSLVGYFENTTEAQRLLGEWGFVDGFFVNYEPPGLSADILSGGHVLHLELYRFGTLEGARAAWDHIYGVHLRRQDNNVLDLPGIGNASLSVRVVQGTVQNSDEPAAYERTLFRRGNLIAIVQAYGADELLPEGVPRAYASRIDEKATGLAPTPAPTPYGADIPTPPVAEGGETPTPIPVDPG